MFLALLNGAPTRTRTWNLQLRRLLHYPVVLWAQSRNIESFPARASYLKQLGNAHTIRTKFLSGAGLAHNSRKEATAINQSIIIEVVVRVMQGTAALAIADDDVTTWDLFSHKEKSSEPVPGAPRRMTLASPTRPLQRHGKRWSLRPHSLPDEITP